MLMTKMNLRLKLHFLCLLCLCPLFHAFSQWQRVVHQRAVHHTAPKVAMSDMGQRVETALANKFKKRDIRCGAPAASELPSGNSQEMACESDMAWYMLDECWNRGGV